MGLYAHLGVCPSFDASHKFVTSPFIRSPVILALVRVTAALYTVLVLLVALIWKTVKLNEGNGCVVLSIHLFFSFLANNLNTLGFIITTCRFFSYFTYLAYIGLCAYYCASSTQTIAYAIGWRKLGAGAGYPLQRWPKVLQALHIILRATVVTFGAYIPWLSTKAHSTYSFVSILKAILVTIVFWSLLSNPSTLATPFNGTSFFFVVRHLPSLTHFCFL